MLLLLFFVFVSFCCLSFLCFTVGFRVVSFLLSAFVSFENVVYCELRVLGILSSAVVSSGDIFVCLLVVIDVRNVGEDIIVSLLLALGI